MEHLVMMVFSGLFMALSSCRLTGSSTTHCVNISIRVNPL